MVFTTHVPALGRYAFLLHGYQPAHPTFAVEVLINGGRVWQGKQRGGPRGEEALGGLVHTAHRVIPYMTWMGRVLGPQLTGAVARCPLSGCDRATCRILPSALT